MIPEIVFAPERIDYDGTQLRSHWAFDTFGVSGDCLVVFRGACNVELSNLVDLADRRAGQGIRAADMLHFIAEHFCCDLPRAVLLQRLLVCIAAEALAGLGVPVQRRNDDLFVHGRKLSVSIATVSPVSGLIHLGINVDPSGAPVPAIGLGHLSVDPEGLGRRIAGAYRDELTSITEAQVKVRWVR